MIGNTWLNGLCNEVYILSTGVAAFHYFFTWRDYCVAVNRFGTRHLLLRLALQSAAGRMLFCSRSYWPRCKLTIPTGYTPSFLRITIFYNVVLRLFLMLAVIV